MTYLAVGLAAVLCGSQISKAQNNYAYPFQNPALSAEGRITDLLPRMTLEEKIFCLGIDPGVPRLGVKGSGHIEGLSGVALGGNGGWAGTINKPVPATQFTEAKGMGQSWDPTYSDKSLQPKDTRRVTQRKIPPMRACARPELLAAWLSAARTQT